MDPSRERNEDVDPGSLDDPNESSASRRRSSVGLSLIQSNSSSSMPSMVTPSSTRSSLSFSYYNPDSEYSYMPPHRPMVGGGAAAAYEALRHDFYKRKHEERMRSQRLEQQLSVGHTIDNQFIHPNHFDLLRVHHHNLIQEMQETSTILNLFQQGATSSADRPPPTVSERFTVAERSNSAGAKRTSDEGPQMETAKRHKSLDD